VIEAALYGLTVIEPLAIWLVAVLNQDNIIILGVILPTMVRSNRELAANLAITRDIGAGLVLLLLALHLRNRSIAFLAAATRSLSQRGRQFLPGRNDQSTQTKSPRPVRHDHR
jgi:hypothetical protein